MAGCDVVFHGAADYRLFAADPQEIYRNNVGGTRNVLTAATEQGVQKLVYTSSVATLALSADGAPSDENAAAALSDMVGDYKRSKFLAEREVESFRARGLPVVLVSPSTPVGEGDIKPTPTGKIIVDFLNRRMPAYVDTGLNLIDVRDVAAGHLLAADKGRLGENYILANTNLTLKEMLDLLARLTGLPAPRFKLPHWIPTAIAHVETPIARWFGRQPTRPDRRRPDVPQENVLRRRQSDSRAGPAPKPRRRRAGAGRPLVRGSRLRAPAVFLRGGPTGLTKPRPEDLLGLGDRQAISLPQDLRGYPLREGDRARPVGAGLRVLVPDLGQTRSFPTVGRA